MNNNLFKTIILVFTIGTSLSCAHRKVVEKNEGKPGVEEVIATLAKYFQEKKNYPDDLFLIGTMLRQGDHGILQGLRYKSDGKKYKIIVPHYGGVSGDCTYYSDDRWICSDFLPNHGLEEKGQGSDDKN